MESPAEEGFDAPRPHAPASFSTRPRCRPTHAHESSFIFSREPFIEPFSVVGSVSQIALFAWRPVSSSPGANAAAATARTFSCIFLICLVIMSVGRIVGHGRVGRVWVGSV